MWGEAEHGKPGLVVPWRLKDVAFHDFMVSRRKFPRARKKAEHENVAHPSVASS
jgi:hypothetical protein